MNRRERRAKRAKERRARDSKPKEPKMLRTQIGRQTLYTRDDYALVVVGDK